MNVEKLSPDLCKILLTLQHTFNHTVYYSTYSTSNIIPDPDANDKKATEAF